MKLFFVSLLFLLTGCSDPAVKTGDDQKTLKTGDVTDNLHNVHVYYNGTPYHQSHGRHYSTDKARYYYGKKWQCVEFVKRYFYLHYKHKMPNIWGNAIDFFNSDLRNGQFKPDRGLYQYHNGSAYKPKVGDMIIFPITKYGHVAIVSEVGEDYIEIIQQNTGESRRKLSFKKKDDKFTVEGQPAPLGFLTINK